MEKPTACVTCGAPLEQPPTGRPRTYCGQACRRAAEYELRRAQSLLTIAEKAEQRHRLAAASTSYAVREARAATAWESEVTRLRGRLRELLADASGDEGVGG